MVLLVVLLSALAVTSIVVAAYAYVADLRRRTLLERALASGDFTGGGRSVLLAPTERAPSSVRAQLARVVPSSWVGDLKAQDQLVQAGFDTPTATTTFALVRLAALIIVPTFSVAIGFGDGLISTVGALLIGLAIAWVVPAGLLARLIRQRQDRIRKGIPDALDLMLVSVEAGISFDAAILRVAREMQSLHPDLANELLTVIRKTNAGASREEALRGLYKRTGVEEIRALVANIVQSERWGTSVGKVLRTTAATLRRKRRQSAEKRAATASLKMTIPLVILILPALFVTILGPAVLSVIGTFKGE
jgi:tight adherence protein C